jgi:hypothetical protein
MLAGIYVSKPVLYEFSRRFVGNGGPICYRLSLDIQDSDFSRTDFARMTMADSPPCGAWSDAAQLEFPFCQPEDSGEFLRF